MRSLLSGALWSCAFRAHDVHATTAPVDDFVRLAMRIWHFPGASLRYLPVSVRPITKMRTGRKYLNTWENNGEGRAERTGRDRRSPAARHAQGTAAGAPMEPAVLRRHRHAHPRRP